MKLQQLRYIVEVADRDLNVTTAAEHLHTSQPGVSKQIRLLEDELGLRIFERSGKHLSGITSAGEKILYRAREVLAQTSNIESFAAEARAVDKGSITLATTHTQARYALPKTILAFRQQYPSVTLHMHQGAPRQIAEWASRGKADFCVATEAMELFENLVMMPCYHWNRCILVTQNHPLAQLSKVSIQDLAQHPIVTYVVGFTGRGKINEAFSQHGLEANIVLTAVDADVIKTYVRLGLGVGIVANMAYDPSQDSDLVAIPADHLFSRSTTRLGFRSDMFMRQYFYDFMALFAPHLTPEFIDQVLAARTAERREKLYATMSEQLPYMQKPEAAD